MRAFIMSTIISDTKTSYAWVDEKFTNKNEYATAICIANGMHKFCTIWNPLKQTGYLGRWSPTGKTWTNLGGSFNSPINQMCVDTNGNVYMVGDKNAAGNYGIKIHNAISGQWSEADNGIKSPITKICCDTLSNVYVTGNFTNSNGLYYIERYNTINKTWSSISEVTVTEPVLDWCLDSHNNMYILCSDFEGQVFVKYWNGPNWGTINSSNFSKKSAITCDNEGNLYFNNNTTVMSYNISAKVFTDLHHKVPSYSGTDEFFLSYIDDTLYFAGYGYTSTANTSAFVVVYSSSIWKIVTPPQLEESYNVIYDITSYEGKSSNVLVASNVNGILDGDQLIH